MSKHDRPNAPQPTDTMRRAFVGATLVAPALVVTPAAARRSAPSPADDESESAEVRGYHVTDRVRTYYRLARF